MLASELYAISQGSRCEGRELCHWCGAKCPLIWLHDDLPMLPHYPKSKLAKQPSRHFICNGCWHWRRKYITVRSLSGLFYQDRQSPKDHSWFVTCESAHCIHYKLDAQDLYHKLLNPPLQFMLSLLTEDDMENHLQMCIVNDLTLLSSDTELSFTINNITHTYSIYQLEEALSNHETNGKDPGVRELIQILGPYQGSESLREKKGKGRHGIDDIPERKTKKVVKSQLSGHNIIS